MMSTAETKSVLRFGLRRSCIYFLLVCICLARVGQAADTLTNASDILALPPEKSAAGVPVSITGIVTVAETNWGGRYFMQDASGGVFVESISQLQPVPGDVVKVSGITRAGGYAPCITKPHWEKIGTAPLPEAKPVTIDQLMSGAEDSQRVEISGVVRATQVLDGQVIVEIVSSGYRLHAYTPIAPDTDLQSLVGTKVRLRATAATSYNAQLRHFLTVTLYVPKLEDFIVEQAAPAGLFEAPLTPLNAIAQYRRGNPPSSQVHVKGVVLYRRKGVDLFLQDATGGLQVKSKLVDAFAPGDVVEAVGFPAVENFLPVLEDATIRKTSEPRVELKPQPANMAELQQGLHHADLITLQARLIDRLVKGIGQMTNAPVIQTTLVLQSSNLVFVAEKDTVEQNGFLTAIPIGSLVEVNGICLLDTADDGKIKSLHLLLPTSNDVRILQKPSWLTPRHLLASLAVVIVVLLVVVGWSLMVSKRNVILKSLVREKEAAQHELQKAHDELEERVKERTAQLKVEMTARKESELQFRAVLTERTRLAQELHDTLEQTSTGVALQLDLVSDQFQKNPGDAMHHLKVARNLMRQSQLDIRHSVWGLRSRADEQFNLVNALTMTSRQIANGAGLQIQVETSGEAQPLSEIVEENLLRIGQEAITNVVKHSGAKTAKVELNFSPRAVILEIRDDGHGFAPENCAGPKDGHFGLLGIRERTERLGGRVSITSTPETGTSLRIEIPVKSANGEPLPSPIVEGHEERV
jgi:signal transduction histidine kinase